MPPPVVRWMHNGQEISNISSYRCRAFDDGISTLEIVAVTEERCGTYTAVASSPHGDAHSSAVIKLDYVSDQVISCLNILRLSSLVRFKSNSCSTPKLP